MPIHMVPLIKLLLLPDARSDLEAVVNSILDDIVSPKPAAPTMASHHDNVGILLDAAIFSKHGDGEPENQMSFEDFQSWCHSLPAVRKYLGSLLTTSDAGLCIFTQFFSIRPTRMLCLIYLNI